MPTLNWIGKEAVINHHKEVPFRLLDCDPTLSVGEPDGNLLIEGDNLEALKALLPYYAGKVKCIYIDPPYNTGNERWVYNDNVNSPQIRKWLGKVVGGEGEDLSRHDKWLCMMYPRLKLLWELLSQDGSLWISIDDNENYHLRAALNEILGEHNFVATVIWEKIYSPKSSARHLSANHDYILLYARNADEWERNLLPRSEKQDKPYRNRDNDPRGRWKPSGLDARNYYSEGTYSITTPSGRVIPGPPKGSYWRVSKEKLEELNADDRIWWGKRGQNVPAIKRFLSEVRGGIVPQTVWPYADVGHTQEAKKEIVRLLPDAAEVFPTPKPTRLIRRILQIATNAGDIVLDSFAGSGTTGHSVLQLNKEDNGERRFILVELESDIARSITSQRLRRVSEGYTWTDQRGNERHEAGLGGGFRYCTLGTTVFRADGVISDGVTWQDLARHIWFAETRNPWPGVPLQAGGCSIETCLGMFNGVAYYLYFNGVGVNTFGPAELSELPLDDTSKVVYADTVAVDDAEMDERRVTFKQIPYDVKVD